MERHTYKQNWWLNPNRIFQRSFASTMDEVFSSSSSPEHPLSFLTYLNLLVLRPILAVAFVLSFILLGWVLAWKLVLVHVPLVQEIFGLRKKSIKPKPQNRRRFSNYYSSMKAGNGPESSS